ncbi:MAG: AMP-binding protein [Spirochaetia bacterium]|nr:AMP-binding protein [Spirochaetia bacterium]
METIQDLGKYTFPALLKNSVDKFANRPALSFVDGTPLTYSQINEKSADFSRQLFSYGLNLKDKIAIFASGQPNWGIAYFGIVNCGMIAVPLLQDFSATEVSSIVDHCGVSAFIVEEKLYERIKELKNLPPVIIKLDDFSIIRNDNGIKENFSVPQYEVQEDDTASIIYTSGTTGRSKGVELSHKNLVWNGIQGQTYHRVTKMDRCLSFLPISHVYEFTIGFTMQMMNGSCVYYLGKPPVVSALLPAFNKIQPTIVISVPLVVEKIYKNAVAPAFEKSAFTRTLYKFKAGRKFLHKVAAKKLKKKFGGHIVFFGIGGAKVDPKVERFMKDGKFPYAVGYGLTETAPLLAGSGTKSTVPGCIGPVMEGVDLKIINADEKTGVGEIAVKGPNVMKGYYKAPELNAENFTTKDDECGEGYFKTGDLGLFEKKKGKLYLTLKSRSKNMILGPSGENIYPEDIEFVLNQNQFVSESLVVEGVEGLVALITLDEEKFQKEAENRSKLNIPNFMEKASEFARDIAAQKEAILGEIQYFVNSKVNKNSRINKVKKIDSFEKTASQKIKRYLYDLKSSILKDKDSKNEN